MVNRNVSAYPAVNPRRLTGVHTATNFLTEIFRSNPIPGANELANKFLGHSGLVIRAALGGILMGLANLVPGISGGTMLLAVGVYPTFIAAVAELSTLRFRLSSIMLLTVIAGCGASAILLFAGLIKTWVIDYRWLMYSVFIGLTLGGVPLVWRLARPVTPAVFFGAAAGFAFMLLLSLGLTRDVETGPNFLLLFIAGLAGASAMILPGVSGGYLLLLLGQYETILDAIDRLKIGLLGDSAAGIPANIDLALSTMDVVIPVGFGVVAGIVGVSNLLKWLLQRFEKPTLGALLGLLFGAIIGLWPFQHSIQPQPGDSLRGQLLDAAAIANLDVKDWPIVFFEPSLSEILIAITLIALGFAVTQLIDFISNKLK